MKPLVGDNIITGPKPTVNVADALLPAPSVADIVWLPAVAVLGTVTVAEKLPVELVVIVVGVVTSVVLSNFTVTVLLGLKLEPESVTAVLGWPAVGDSVIAAGIITLNIADAVLFATSVADIV